MLCLHMTLRIGVYMTVHVPKLACNHDIATQLCDICCDISTMQTMVHASRHVRLAYRSPACYVVQITH